MARWTWCCWPGRSAARVVRLVVVTGGKGGPGATTLAVGLASAWAAAGRSVLLADLDPAGGDVAAHLPVPDVRRGVAPLLGLPVGQLDPAAIRAESTQVGWGLQVLVGLAGPDTGGLLRPEAVVALLRAARGVAGVELLVVDPGRLLPGSVAAVTLGLAEVRVLAARADLPGALAAQRALAATQHAPVMMLVAVAVQRPADAAELAHALSRPLTGVIPADPRRVRQALQAGQPLTSGRLSRAYAALAAQLHPAGGRAGRRARGGRRGSLGAGEEATPP
jgi:MinD-like ATPase involved in chromosome partitioning or flagellar assembly